MYASTSHLNGLADLFDPQGVVERLAPIFGGVFGAQRVGVAHVAPGARRFQNIALWDAEDDRVRPQPWFAWDGTAASWVVECSCPMAGESVTDMARFPSTQGYLMRERFSSNLLLPLDLGRYGAGVLYMLSRATGTFTSRAVPAGLRVRAIIEPAVRARCAVHELEHGADETATPAPPRMHAGTDDVLTLDEAQRRHILDVVTRTNWIIDGPRGAAAMLGLRPSTLRNRMRKLRVVRPGPGATGSAPE